MKVARTVRRGEVGKVPAMVTRRPPTLLGIRCAPRLGPDHRAGLDHSRAWAFGQTHPVPARGYGLPNGAGCGRAHAAAHRDPRNCLHARCGDRRSAQRGGVLPCDRPFEVWETRRDHWGDTLGPNATVETERLTWEHVYPLERRLIALVQRELGEGRRVMLYIDQNDLRSTPRRLEWVLKDVQPWTLPNNVAAEDRQQAILQAVQQGHHVVIVPYRRVNEGLNLQSAIDTILWVEMALNLFMLDQASRRAWRLGKREEVRIYYLAYANTVGHTKLRKLGQQSGAAAAFAGEPARGALIEHAGADKTTLARLSSLLEQSEGEEGDDGENGIVQLSVRKRWPRKRQCSRPCLPNARRNCARRWCEGVSGLAASRTISQNALQPSRSCPTARVSVWAERPLPLALSIARTTRQAEQVGVELPERKDERQREPVITLPTNTAPMLAAAALSPTMPPCTWNLNLRQHSLLAVVPKSSSDAASISRWHGYGVDARRPGGYRETPRRRIPVSERDIPSLDEGEVAGADEQCRQVLMPSLWDQLVAPTSQASTANSTLFAVSSHDQHAPLQPQLWEREMAQPRR